MRVLCLLLTACSLAHGAKSKRNDVPRMRQAIVDNRLTELASDCYSVLQFGASQSYDYYEVREVHNKACGGDPEISRRMFAMRVHRQSGAVGFQDSHSDLYMTSPPAFVHSCHGGLILFEGPPSQMASLKPDNGDDPTGPYIWGRLDPKIHYWLGCPDERDGEGRAEKVTEGISQCRLYHGIESVLKCYRGSRGPAEP